MSVHLRKKDKQIQHVLSVKIVGMADKSNDTILSSQLKELKNEMRSISRLTDKVSELEESLHSKDEELKLLKSSMKFTLIKELQIEAQTYFNEARRMKKMLDKKIFKKHVKNNRALR